MDDYILRNYPYEVWIRAHTLEVIHGYRKEVAQQMAIDEYKKEQDDGQ